ncbi:Transcription initiation factor IIA small chain (TFIIA 13.5 kDa subunit) [Quaeritorhiza haematococci]|nr:Transcription initiation factor IIA small chain (TFIIA 13.5 kDa subunit) [Quaeritorhiza haematococci]
MSYDSYQLYRRSSVGMALTDTLDELIQKGLIDPQLGMKTMAQFDMSIAKALHQKVKSQIKTLKGHLLVYRFCDEVWTFVIEKPTFKMENEVVSADKVKIVACAAKAPPADNGDDGKK